MSRHMRKRRREIETATQRPADELLDEVAALIAGGSSVVFITGAGISVSAGIPAFRSGTDAVWTENVVESAAAASSGSRAARGADRARGARRYGTRKALRRDPVHWYNEFWLPTFECARLKTATRTAAHDALGALATLAPRTRVVTQNVDGLHVGSVPDPQLVEAHGRAGLFRCAGIGAAAPGRPRCPADVATTEWYLRRSL